MYLPVLSTDTHLDVKSWCDVGLDVHYYNGHTTTADMLWAGVPVLTYPGEYMVARVAAAFDKLSDIEEMIVANWTDYEEKAVWLCQNKTHLNRLQHKLFDNREKNPLFNEARFIRNLERGWQLVVDRHRQNLKPEDVHVQQNP